MRQQTMAAAAGVLFCVTAPLVADPPAPKSSDSKTKRVCFVAIRSPGDQPNERRIQVEQSWRSPPFERDTWRVRYPVCKPGMVIPILRRVGKVASVQNLVDFQMLGEAELPQGVEAPGDRFVLPVGGSRDAEDLARLEIARVGPDAAGNLSVDLKQRWKPSTADSQSAVYNDLHVGSQFTLEEIDWQSDYRIEQIIAPDEKEQLVGWITVAPVLNTFQWRKLKARPLDVPETFTLHHRPHPQLDPLPSFRGDFEFVGCGGYRQADQATYVRIGIEQEVGSQFLESKKETWGYTSSPCEPGLLLPICGKIVRTESVSKDFVFRALADAELPEGVAAPGDQFPVILGACVGAVRLQRIADDETGSLFVDIKQSWNERRSKHRIDTRFETLNGLKVGSTFTRRLNEELVDYRIMQIVAPDAERHVPGWITLRPVAGTRKPRRDPLRSGQSYKMIPGDARMQRPRRLDADISSSS